MPQFYSRLRRSRRPGGLQSPWWRSVREAAKRPDGYRFDLRMMRRAIELARLAATEGEVPVGAVVTCEDQVIAEAYNTREADADPTTHAEMTAMRLAAMVRGHWRLNHCTLYVTLEPCPMCAGAIVNARVGRVVYGAADPKAGAVRSLYRLCDDPRLNHRARIVSGVLAVECGQVLKDFFRERRLKRGGERRG